MVFENISQNIHKDLSFYNEHMGKKDLAEYQRKYAFYRHHAWAGAILLSVVFALHYLFDIESRILYPLIVALVIYIIVALFFTYKYHMGLGVRAEEISTLSPKTQEKKIKYDTQVEKARLKREKKQVKAEVKARKKDSKR